MKSVHHIFSLRDREVICIILVLLARVDGLNHYLNIVYKAMKSVYHIFSLRDREVICIILVLLARVDGLNHYLNIYTRPS